MIVLVWEKLVFWREYCTKRIKKAIWVTANTQLFGPAFEEAKQFWKQKPPIAALDVTQICDKIPGLSNFNVLFITYKSLVDSKKYNKITKWMGTKFNGVVCSS